MNYAFTSSIVNLILSTLFKRKKIKEMDEENKSFKQSPLVFRKYN